MVAIAEILVTPETGSIQVTRFTVGVECGKIINPRQLERCIRGGVVIGLGEALKEEVTFDKFEGHEYGLEPLPDPQHA